MAALDARPRGKPSLPDGLTAREAEVVGLIARGLTNAEIAAELCIGEAVKTHINNAFAKIGVRHRAEAVRYGLEHQLWPVPTWKAGRDRAGAGEAAGRGPSPGAPSTTWTTGTARTTTGAETRPGKGSGDMTGGLLLADGDGIMGELLHDFLVKGLIVVVLVLIAMVVIWKTAGRKRD
ncbi:helix-turn-helix domain-containing protein [Amycolatopsis thermalba]|uniref:helix-turn-helix domain-containing protein n=1 Tax=Amycolatopsis TaxID=1813 RepID=UPI003D20EB3F